MAVNNPYETYQKNKILTASPAELTLILYEGAIKFCNIASRAIDEGDIQKANENIIKAERIIDEFRATLNHKYPVAKDFEVVYDYIYHFLVEANIHKDKEALEKALEELRSMSDTWKEVMKTANSNKA